MGDATRQKVLQIVSLNGSSSRFVPPGAGGVTQARHVRSWHPTDFGQTISLLVISSVLLGVGVSLLILVGFGYVKNRKKRGVTPFFFIMAILSGLNLLVLCIMHMIILRLRLRCLQCLGGRMPIYRWGTLLDGLDLGAWLDSWSLLCTANIVGHVENINLLFLELVILRRLQALFPGETWLSKMARLMLLASGTSFFLTIGLHIPNNLPAPSGCSNGFIALSNMLSDIFHLHAYIGGSLSVAINIFATWCFIAKWRYLKLLQIDNGYYRRRKKNDPLRKLEILIYGGLLLGLSQVAWYIIYTFLSIGDEVQRVPLDYILPRFVFYAMSALYPTVTYVALRWNTPAEEIYIVDLFDVPGYQDQAIPMDDLGSTPYEDKGPDNGDSLIDVDTEEADIQE